MKKIILLSLLLISVVCGKSVEEIQSDWQQRFDEKRQKQLDTFWQNEEVMRAKPHCGSGDNMACKKLIDLTDKYCKNGLAGSCAALTEFYSQGYEQFGVKIDKNKAKFYADKVCALDATFCVNAGSNFKDKDISLALGYFEKSCAMGEHFGCVLVMTIYHNGIGGIAKNPQKVKYYGDKLCKAGHKEACQ